MLKNFLLTITLSLLAFASIAAQTMQSVSDTVMVLPFENTSGKTEFNWVGESFADSLSDLLGSKEVRITRLNVISNRERQIIQQKLNIPLTILPSLATSLKLARESKSTLLVAGKYNIEPAKDDIAARLTVSARIIRVNEGRFLSEEFPDGKRVTREIVINDALANLQTVQGQVAFQILYQWDRALPFKGNEFVDLANKVPARAFEAYIKGLLTPDTDLQSRENFFKNAMRIYADDDKTKGGIYSDAALELGHFYLNQRKLAEAIDYFSRVPQESGQYPEAAFYTGLIHWQRENYEQALAVLRPLADELKLETVYNALGAISVQASRVEKKNKGNADKLLQDGIEFLKRASESATENQKARFNYGLALFLSGNYPAAKDQMLVLAEKNQKDGEIYFLLAKIFEKLGDTVKAADADDKARRFLIENNRYAKLETDWKSGKLDGINLRVEQPLRKDFVSVVLTKKPATTTQTPLSETESLLQQAETLYKNGNDDEAMAILRKVLGSEPMSAQAYLLLGMIHLRRGDLEQSISSLKTALFWDNRLTSAHVALGKIYIQKGDCLQAKNYAASASAIDAENQEVAALQRQVERCSPK
jgi:tetratricopeptide (TPR) repeat protein